MEKSFNLNIDTKDKKIMNVTGIKQFDNNSVLYINIAQNSVCFDLTDCTARLNFLKEDKEVLLYMADVIDAKKGKIKIKLSTQILKNPGSIKCDLSIFDKNIMKITSLDFTIQVEKTIYSNEYYLQRADFDIVQSMHIEEEKRLKNERERIAAENTRNSNESTRNKNENIRKDNETKRIVEWNSVKKDATNLKNTLDNTISTANNTNSNLKNTINAGDKLKEDLNINSYVKNADYQQFEKKTNTQYEDLTKQLNNFGSRNYLLNVSEINTWESPRSSKEIIKDTYFNKDVLKITLKNTSEFPCGAYIPSAQVLNDLIKDGETCTWSVWMRSDKPIRLRVGHERDGMSGRKDISVSTEWKRYINTYIVKKNNDYKAFTFYILDKNIDTTSFYIFEPKLEKGSIATDWSIAPEEIIANSKRLDVIEQVLIEKGFNIAKNKLN